jgi:hypothetical protein
MSAKLTREQAIRMGETRWWEGLDDLEIVVLQLYEDWLAMPWDAYHAAVERCLDRGVFTHEFADHRLLQRELEARVPALDFARVVEKVWARLAVAAK